MSHAYDDCYAFYSETWHKANKEHACSACLETIKPGHQYCRAAWAFEGEFDNVKRCARCQAMHKHLRNLAPGDAWPAERLDCGERYEDDWGTAPPPEIAALAFITQDEAQALAPPAHKKGA